MSHVKKTFCPPLPLFLPPPHPHLPNPKAAIKKCLPSYGGALSQTDSPEASPGPIDGPWCALPRRACFRGRPLLRSGRTTGARQTRSIQDRRCSVCNGGLSDSDLLHCVCVGFSELSIRWLVVLIYLFLLFSCQIVVVFASGLIAGLHFCCVCVVLSALQRNFVSACLFCVI